MEIKCFQVFPKYKIPLKRFETNFSSENPSVLTDNLIRQIRNKKPFDKRVLYSSDRIEPPTYAILFLIEGKYQNHGYVFVTPLKPDVCICFGISEEISEKFIFEGVRRFALERNCSRIYLYEKKIPFREDTKVKNLHPTLYYYSTLDDKKSLRIKNFRESFIKEEYRFKINHRNDNVRRVIQNSLAISPKYYRIETTSGNWNGSFLSEEDNIIVLKGYFIENRMSGKFIFDLNIFSVEGKVGNLEVDCSDGYFCGFGYVKREKLLSEIGIVKSGKWQEVFKCEDGSLVNIYKYKEGDNYHIFG